MLDGRSLAPLELRLLVRTWKSPSAIHIRYAASLITFGERLLAGLHRITGCRDRAMVFSLTLAEGCWLSAALQKLIIGHGRSVSSA